MSIAIVFGGNSVEHDVSIVTAKQIYEVAKIKYDVKLIYVDKTDNLFLYNSSEFSFDDFKGNSCHFSSIFLKDGVICKHSAFGKIRAIKIDCAIFCCHGANGENGKIQTLFELAKIPVSAGSNLALALAMNKWQTKSLAKSIGIDCVEGLLVSQFDDIQKSIKSVEERIGYPVIVKPTCSGSSIGIDIANNSSELESALKVAFEFDTSAVVEKALVQFDEYNCAVLGDSQSFVVSEIDKPIKKDKILSFADKYLSSNKKSGMKKQARDFPAKLEKKLYEKIQKWSKKVFLEFGFFGVIRIDYLFDKQTKKLYLNEINAVPGSLAIYFFSGRKMNSVEFIDRLIEIAKNQSKMAKNNANFKANLF